MTIFLPQLQPSWLLHYSSERLSSHDTASIKFRWHPVVCSSPRFALTKEAGLLGSHRKDAGESLKLNTLGPIEMISNVEVRADLQLEAGDQIDDTTASYMEIDQLDTTIAMI